MTTRTLDEVQAHLRQIIVGLEPGEEAVIVDSGQPVAKLVRIGRTNWPCKAGSARDTILWIAPDFDAPLQEFKDYME